MIGKFYCMYARHQPNKDNKISLNLKDRENVTTSEDEFFDFISCYDFEQFNQTYVINLKEVSNIQFYLNRILSILNKFKIYDTNILIDEMKHLFEIRFHVGDKRETSDYLLSNI